MSNAKEKGARRRHIREALEHQDRELLEEAIKSYFKKQQEKSQNSMGRCEYCDSIEQATPKSPRKRYIYCPMCGEKLSRGKET